MSDIKTIDATSGAAGTATLDVARLQTKERRDTNGGCTPSSCATPCSCTRPTAASGHRLDEERHFVSGSTKKMYKQKHTGNARQGDGKAPHFRGGGIAFGPHPRDYSYHDAPEGAAQGPRGGARRASSPTARSRS